MDYSNLKFNFYTKDNHIKETVEEGHKKILFEVLQELSDKERLVYRGFSKERVNESFLKFIFTVGEKGAYYRSRVSGVDGDFLNQKEVDEEKYRGLCHKLVTALEGYKHKGRINDIKCLSATIEEYRVDNEISHQEMYYFILVWLHNIGRSTGLKESSPLVSTSTSIDVAFTFCDNNSSEKYVLVVLVTDSKISDYVSTDRLNEILKGINIDWFENIHKEIMFKDAIFPHSILGIIKRNEKEDEMIINPFLLDLIEEISRENLVGSLLGKGIKVDQSNFDTESKSLGYENKVVQYKAERKIGAEEEYNVDNLQEHDLFL